MAVQAQFGGLAGCLPPYAAAAADCLADEQVRALLSAAAAGNKACQYACAAGVGKRRAERPDVQRRRGGVAVAEARQGGCVL